MGDPETEVGADRQTSVAPAENVAATGSTGDVSPKLEPADSGQGSQSTVAAPGAAAAAAMSVGTVATAQESAAGAETDDGVKTEPTETPEGGTAAPPVEGPGAGGAAGDRVASDQQRDTVPQLVRVVNSARSVFRQRDVKEYDPFTAHLERRITKLFEALDTEQTGRVDVHELGTLIRSVGCCPSETELQEMVTQLEEEGQPGFIRLQTVMPYIIQCVEDRKYPSASTEQLLQAFKVLADDCAAQEEARAGPKREKKEEERDTLPQDKLVHILTEEGEHFSQEEVEEMLSVVPASESARVQYTEFVKQLVVPELW